MTSQPEPAPRDATPAAQTTSPLREPAALVLLSANALLLLVGLVDLLVPISGGASFAGRAGGAFFNFAGLAAVLLPLVAVLLATHVSPPVRRARLITRLALGEYVVAAVFAVLAFVGWLAGGLTDAAFRSAFNGLLTRIAYCAVLAIAAVAVLKVWRAVYHVPRRKREPGLYGRPKRDQPAYAADYGQDQPTAYGQPTVYGQPRRYAESPAVPTQPIAVGQPAHYGDAEAAPTSAPPTPSAAPVSGSPAGSIEETQVIERPADPAATQRFEAVGDQFDSDAAKPDGDGSAKPGSDASAPDSDGSAKPGSNASAHPDSDGAAQPADDASADSGSVFADSGSVSADSDGEPSAKPDSGASAKSASGAHAKSAGGAHAKSAGGASGKRASKADPAQR